MERVRWLLPMMALLLGSSGLGGCFFFVDEPEDRGHDPTVYDSGATYWFCEYDAATHDYYWEYQAEVGDPDGLGNIRLVDVTFYHASTGALIDQIELYDEGGGIWGAYSWESETLLYCGDPYDAVFYVEDDQGNSDSLYISNATSAPAISEDPVDTWVDCYQSGYDWIFEFQTRVSDHEGYEDVDYVLVSFVDYYSGVIDGEYTLSYEGDGYWGGWIEEGNGNELLCGEPYTVEFYAEDDSGMVDSFVYDWMG